jgi:hypothetical protein
MITVVLRFYSGKTGSEWVFILRKLKVVKKMAGC